MKSIRVLFLLICLLLLSSCGSKTYENGVVNVLNWSSYIPSEIISDFEKEYKIKVNYLTYSSNEELLAKITSSKEGTYDIIFPSDYMVELMKSKDLLLKLDKSKIEHLEEVNEQFLNQEFDKNNDYSIPFLAASIVLAVNKDIIKDDITSYNDLLNKKYEGSIALVDDQRIVIGMGLLANGYDMNTITKYELNASKNYLKNLRNNIKAYDSDSPKTLLITEEASIGLIWDAEAKIAKELNNNIEISYPKEGHAISMDNYCILKTSKNTENAYKFINYLMRKEISERIVDEYPYTSPINGVVDESSLCSFFGNGFYVENIGQYTSRYDEVWAEVK